jgi:hypothetical protein
MVIMKFHRLTVIVVCLLLAASCRNGGKSAPEEDLKAIEEMKSDSLKILPESYQNIWLGITEDEFVKARTNAKAHLAKSDPEERKWYREVDATGVNVWFGFERASKRLVVIQFANSLPTWKVFDQHATLLVEKYGTDNELYTCPTGDPKFSMTRLLWPKQPVSIMEAVLEADNAVSVTMVVSLLKDARKAIERQKCLKVNKEQALEQWLEQELKEEQKLRPDPKPPGECEACEKEKDE